MKKTQQNIKKGKIKLIEEEYSSNDIIKDYLKIVKPVKTSQASSKSMKEIDQSTSVAWSKDNPLMSPCMSQQSLASKSSEAKAQQVIARNYKTETKQKSLKADSISMKEIRKDLNSLMTSTNSNFNSSGFFKETSTKSGSVADKAELFKSSANRINSLGQDSKVSPCLNLGTRRWSFETGNGTITK